MSAGSIYGVYFSCVLLVSIIVFAFYYRLRNSQKWNSLVIFAYVFGAIFLLQFLIVIITMIIGMSQDKNNIMNSDLYTQMTYNGFAMHGQRSASNSSAPPESCNKNQIIIGYIPAIFYGNMFSLAFLEIKSLTKISDTKSSKDWKIGIFVITTILVSYLSVYIAFFIGNYSIDLSQSNLANTKQHFIVGLYNQFVTMPDPFQTGKNSKT